MRIIAKAKPIQIRIKSGGEEHFSLDSLRQNLNVQDLWPLIQDNRLSRWLRQLGEVDLAHEIDALSESQLNFSTYFKVLVLFLNDDLVEHHVTELYTLFTFWHDCGKIKSKNYDSLRKYLLSQYEGAKFIFKQYPEEASDGEWWNVFCKFEKEEDPEFLFKQGKLAFDGFTKSDGSYFDKNLVRSKKLIEKAAEFHNQEAIDFLKSNQLISHRRKSMQTPEALNKIQRQIDRWKTDKWGYINNIVSSDEEIVKEAKLLLREFASILKTYYEFPNSVLVRETKIKLENLEKSKLFYVENRFVLELLLYKYAKNDNSISNLFVDLANKYNYPLAKYMINPPKDGLIDGFNFRGKYLSYQLGFIIDHLFDFYE